jgi:hypothetical protein
MYVASSKRGWSAVARTVGVGDGSCDVDGTHAAARNVAINARLTTRGIETSL